MQIKVITISLSKETISMTSWKQLFGKIWRTLTATSVVDLLVNHGKTGPTTPGGPGRGGSLPHFWVAKRWKGNKEKKERVWKQKLLKSCHQGQNVTVLAILERLELSSVPWPLHFEIHFARPEKSLKTACSRSIGKYANVILIGKV